MSYKRESGEIVETFYGREDHGILTVSVRLQFGAGGSHQSFGNLAFERDHLADDFVRDLCATFAVTNLDDLRGRSCYALRCFDGLNEPIEALESARGRRFIISAWRRKHYPDSPNPLAARKAHIQNDIALYTKRIAEARQRLERLDAEYTAVEPT